MRLPGSIATVTNNEGWRLPVLVGLASTPVSVVLSQFTVNGPWVVILIAGLFVGYRVSGRSVGSGRVGWRTGLIGAFAYLWSIASFALLLPGHFPWTVFGVFAGVSAVVGLVLVTAFAFVLSGSVGAIGGVVGGRLSRWRGESRSAVGPH
ncbi:DUF5518 domain-containing protein [Natrialbaceae archaeon A-CW3]